MMEYPGLFESAAVPASETFALTPTRLVLKDYVCVSWQICRHSHLTQPWIPTFAGTTVVCRGVFSTTANVLLGVQDALHAEVVPEQTESGYNALADAGDLGLASPGVRV